MIGREVSHYRIVARLGAGGMGEVYEAEDTVLERRVAVKVLPADLSADPERRRRFLREARSASALDHRGIVTVHNVVHADGHDHLVMELVRGETLDRKVPQKGLPEAEALHYAVQVADALAAAHAGGVIHRDLKPGNVMVTGDDRVKVLDFGLAKLETESGAASMEPLTRAGAVFGTMEFMSPEQAMGEPVDARSDIFSFGILLYFLLTGERPFQGKNAASVLHAVAYEEPAPYLRMRGQLSPRLHELVAATLEKNPADRIQSMAEVAAALRNLRTDAGEAARVPDAPTLYQDAPPAHASGSHAPLARRLRRLPPRRAAVLLLVLGLAALGVVALRQGWPAKLGLRPGTPAPAAQELGAHELFHRGMTLLARYDREGNTRQAIDHFGRILADDERSAPALAGLARAYWIEGSSGSADKVRLDQALAVAEQAVESDDLFAESLVSRGLAYQEVGRLDDAEADLRRALSLDPANADALFGLGRVQQRRGDVAAAEAVYRRAIETRPDGWQYYAHLGDLLHRNGRYGEAAEVFLQGLERVPDNSRNLRNLGAAYYMQGDLAGAASAFQRALLIEPDAWLYSNLGTIQFAQGLYAQAVSAFEKAVEEGGANTYAVWANLADAYRWTPDNEEKTREAYQRALQLLDEQLAAAPDDPTLRSRRALYLAKRGDRDAALGEIARLRSLPHLDAAAWFRLGVAHELLGQRRPGLEALSAALEAGYSLADLENDPELMELRKDPAYHRLLVRLADRDEP